jgi:hypothetical protein
VNRHANDRVGLTDIGATAALAWLVAANRLRS